VTGSSGPARRVSTYRFRDLDPYDAVMMSAAGVPQPLMVVQAHVLRGGVLADSLDAVVAADNTVATLMLETGMGTFVRYGGDWQLLRDDSGALDDMGLVSVSPGALVGLGRRRLGRADHLGVRPAAEGRRRRADQPRALRPGRGDGGGHRGQRCLHPAIACEEDLDLGIRYANAHPEARWYVTKRARALAASGADPGALERGPGGRGAPFQLGGAGDGVVVGLDSPAQIQAAACLFSDLAASGRKPPRRDVPAIWRQPVSVV
jgi:hypothetical protein